MTTAATPAEFIPARPDDAAEMVQIQIAAFHYDSVLYPEVELGGPPGYDSVTDLLAKIARHDCYKIVHAGQLVGGIVVWIDEAERYHLDVIFIAPTAQNHGIGTQAIHFLEARYPAATRWTLDTPRWAIRNRHFYEKLGYVSAREYDDNGFPLIAYEKRIAPLR